MSQDSVNTTTKCVTGECYIALTTTMTDTIAATSIGIAGALGQYYVVCHHH